MKKLMLLLLLLLSFENLSEAQCVAKIKNVFQDDMRGSIVVETEYYLNGTFIQNGKSRYDETTGTNDEIIAKAKEDIDFHCGNIIRRLEANETFLQNEYLKIQKALTSPIIESIKSNLIGYTSNRTEAVDEFKGQQIKVTVDEKNTVSAIAVESK